MDCDGKSESSPEREAVDGEAKGVEGTEGVRKRKRKPYRPGVSHAACSDPKLIYVKKIEWGRGASHILYNKNLIR